MYHNKQKYMIRFDKNTKRKYILAGHKKHFLQTGGASLINDTTTELIKDHLIAGLARSVGGVQSLTIIYDEMNEIYQMGNNYFVVLIQFILSETIHIFKIDSAHVRNATNALIKMQANKTLSTEENASLQHFQNFTIESVA